MKRRPLVAVASVLSARTGVLAALRDGANERRALDDTLTKLLGPPLCRHVRVGRCSPDGLVLVADSPVWAARLRFRSREILDQLGPKLGSPPPRRVEVSVATTPHGAPQPPSRRPGRLSGGTAALLDEVAGALADNPRLARALGRLAARARSGRRGT